MLGPKPIKVHIILQSPEPCSSFLGDLHNGEQLDHVMLSVPNTAIPGSIRASIYLTGHVMFAPFHASVFIIFIFIKI